MGVTLQSKRKDTKTVPMAPRKKKEALVSVGCLKPRVLFRNHLGN